MSALLWTRRIFFNGNENPLRGKHSNILKNVGINPVGRMSGQGGGFLVRGNTPQIQRFAENEVEFAGMETLYAFARVEGEFAKEIFFVQDEKIHADERERF